MSNPNDIWAHAESKEAEMKQVARLAELEFMRQLFDERLPVGENKEKIHEYFNEVEQVIFTKGEVKNEQFPDEPVGDGTQKIATNIKRQIFLSSSLADFNLSPHHKIWILPETLNDDKHQYLVNIRTLKFFHLYPSLVADGVIEYYVSMDQAIPTTVTVNRGNWDAYSLANYLTDQMSGDSIKVYYDSGLLKFVFDTSIYIHYINDEMAKLLGFPEGFKSSDYSDMAVDRSIGVIDMCPLKCVNVRTNMSVYNLPVSSILNQFPVDGNYGDHLIIENPITNTVPLVMDHLIKAIEVELLDESNSSLDNFLESSEVDYEIPEWSLTLEIQEIPQS
jgi:hypothetical protein